MFRKPQQQATQKTMGKEFMSLLKGKYQSLNNYASRHYFIFCQYNIDLRFNRKR